MQLMLQREDLLPEFRETPASKVSFEMLTNEVRIAVASHGSGIFKEVPGDPDSHLHVVMAPTNQVSDADKVAALVELVRVFRERTRVVIADHEAKIEILQFGGLVNSIVGAKNSQELQQALKRVQELLFV